jgi:hypothetical protein
MEVATCIGGRTLSFLSCACEVLCEIVQLCVGALELETGVLAVLGYERVGGWCSRVIKNFQKPLKFNAKIGTLGKHP